LEQGICSIAQTGTLGNRQSWDRAAFYKTSTPESISSELEKVASFNKVDPKNKPAYPRYSVAVWQVKDSQTGETTYWIGVERYPSALEEFVDHHFTDDVFYHDDWKKGVAPVCQGS
jgi:hypothetical protein